MDNSLFNKYKKVVEERDEEKEKVIDLIKKESGIILKEDEINIDSKKIILNISAIKRSHLYRKGIKEFLLKSGYILF